FVLVINCGSQVDLTALDGIRIDAILFMVQGGEEGGNALADILSGKVSPSGKLTDTWAYKYEDYPTSNEYGIMGNVLEQDYKEGIYVGYRYFDTFGVEPRYPFGYGLSYTDFAIALNNVTQNNGITTVKVKVTNIGKEYSGKEVVQIYLAKPQGTIKCEKHTLCAFAKTKELKPNESEELTLSFKLADFAVYDESNAQYVLQGGNYGVYVGNSIKTIKPVTVLRLNKDVVTEVCKNVCSKRGDFNELSVDTQNENYSSDLPVIEINADEITTKINRYGELSPIFITSQTEKYLKTLSDKDLIELTVGGGYMGRSYNLTPTVAGRTSINLLKRGIPNINLSDGPAGLRLCPKNAYTKSGSPRYVDSLPEEWQWGWMKKVEKLLLAKPNKGYRVFQYMTAFPCATLQAQTWNVELIREVGKAIGVEMIETGVTVWLAPGMNIHRNPLCGRNFEYYSEDPLVSGLLASAVTQGVQSHKGLGVTIKHFCCNNQEDKREYMSSNVGERALREIYLKGFEIAVKTSAPKSIMTSYNKLNGVYTPNNYELCVSVLRNEWGYKGLVMTDWTATGDKKGKHELCHKCGNDLIEPGGKAVKKYLMKEYKKGNVDMSLVKVSAANVLNLIFESNVYEIKGK
ncbi:MAG: glycoside hydrolase family 3 C-terminal domain-containing protein, partial [Clostridia bacterium]|nr:glycoside hydrolase family 3 C-terminal domain-containing protein [Clostridia bacterium]